MTTRRKPTSEEWGVLVVSRLLDYLDNPKSTSQEQADLLDQARRVGLTHTAIEAIATERGFRTPPRKVFMQVDGYISRQVNRLRREQ